MKRHLSRIAKPLFALLLLLVLYSRLDPGALGERLTGVRWGWVGAFLCILLVNSALSALKWKVLLHADGIRLPFPTLLGSYWIGSFFNVFLPSTIGGDAYRIADVGKRSARTAHTAASVMADRLSGFLALSLYGLLLFPFFFRRYDADPRLLLLPAAAFAGLLGLALALWEQSLLRRITRLCPSRIRDKAETALDALFGSIRVYGARQQVLWVMLLISLLFQFFAILAVYSLARALGLELALLSFGFFVPFITMMEMIPVSVFGIGLRDTGYVWFMQSVGQAREDAAALSLLYVAATLAYVSVGGLLFLRRSLRGTRRGVEMGV